MSRSVAVFVMGQEGHVRRMLPLIEGIAERGDVPHVFTEAAFRDEVERAGGRFRDLHAGRPLDEADAESAPLPCRFVSFAGCFAEDVAREVREIAPRLILYDTFAVIGRVVAEILDIPDANVCCGHNRWGADLQSTLDVIPDYIQVSEACDRWVDVLRERYGLEDATPWSWANLQSEHLNVYCEPARYLDAASREAFEPIEFFGSLPSEAVIDARIGNGADPLFAGDGLRVYVSFGTVVGNFFPGQKLAALRALSGALAERGAAVVLSLGLQPVTPEIRREMTAPNVVVADYVDQLRALASADVFVTHHGLNSTHEAVWTETPMISYPFFGDQPSLAAKCAEFGFATPLAPALADVSARAVHDALDRFESERASMGAAVAAAREWEVQVMDERPAVLDRMLALGSA